MIRVFLPYIRLHGLPIVATLREIKEAGFDGIEYHLIGSSHRAVLRARARAHEFGLGFHMHQGWSLEENPTHWHNYLLALTGCLPRAGYTLNEHIPRSLIELGFPGSITTPVVVYANRIREVMQGGRWHGQGSFWIQTCAPPGGLQIDFDSFLMVVNVGRFRTVFDTQHILEFATACKGVSELSDDREKLLAQLKALWSALAKNVSEIHLADFNPALGNTRGRNVPLGTGVLPLRDFCHMVHESGWQGTVVPEVSGFFWKKKELDALCEQVHGFFA